MFRNLKSFFFRIGRTGRKGNTGTAYTFFTQKNMKSAGELIQILTEANQVNLRQLLGSIHDARIPK